MQASAKLVGVRGQIHALDTAGQRRLLVDGGAVYPGDTVETSPKAQAVLAFRDDSRLTLGASTRFKIDSFVFDAGNPSEGRFVMSLVRGSMRALTGLIARANNRKGRPLLGDLGFRRIAKGYTAVIDDMDLSCCLGKDFIVRLQNSYHEAAARKMAKRLGGTLIKERIGKTLKIRIKY